MTPELRTARRAAVRIRQLLRDRAVARLRASTSDAAQADTDIAGDLEVTGANLTHNSRNVGSSHTHPGVQTGGGITGPPR